MALGCSHLQNLPTQADLIPSPDDNLNISSVLVGVASIEAYGCGYVTHDIQLFVNLLDSGDHD
jgi:hypothetical protein